MIDAQQEKPIWFKSLRMRLAAMMSLALLPIGLIAVLQTNSVSDKARENAELAMLGLTEATALNERLLIQQAFGAAKVLASEMPDIIDDPNMCTLAFSRFIEVSETFSFAGFLPPDGQVTCSSAPSPFDISNAPGFDDAMAERTRRVEVNEAAPASKASVVIVSEPVFAGDEFLGYASISIPHATIDKTVANVDVDALVNIVTYNETGTILTSQIGVTETAENLPSGRDLASLTFDASASFSQQSVGGRDLIYNVVPVEFGQIYILGIWDSTASVAEQANSVVPTSVFPVLMWVISLGVALFAVHRLVTRHIQRLGVQMSQFAATRRFPDDADPLDMPTELQNIHQSFINMAGAILKDEAVIEDAMRQKTVLLKEVHHRVKNNLQLISSILNMQIRVAKHADTKTALRSMQDRVLSLATIHRDLYQTTDVGTVNVGTLVREVVDKSVEIGATTLTSVDVTTDIDDILLFPDQAVPMSLLASEAATNAIKYAGLAEVRAGWVSVIFKCDEERNCTFILTNSVGGKDDKESTGLGSKLISAFAIQLGAQVETKEEDACYTLTVRFQASEFEPEPGNY